MNLGRKSPQEIASLVKGLWNPPLYVQGLIFQPEGFFSAHIKKNQGGVA